LRNYNKRFCRIAFIAENTLQKKSCRPKGRQLELGTKRTRVLTMS